MCNYRPASAAMLAILALATSGVFAADSDKPSLVYVLTRTGISHAGELVNENDESVSLRNLETGKVHDFKKTALKQIELPLSEADAAHHLGLPQLMAWKIAQLPSKQAAVGKIAKVTPNVIYLNLGESSGVVQGQELSVYRSAEPIVDPDTKEILAHERQKLAKLKVVEVAKAYSKARMLGELEVTLEIGDEVESESQPLLVAVLPIDGGEDGSVLAEQLTTTLTNKHIPVVERALLDKVLAEQIVQNTALFDENTAQRIGKILGANAVLTGKIVGAGEAHVRLVDVSNGKILLAASQKLSGSGSTNSGTGRDSTTNGMSSSAAKRAGLIHHWKFDERSGSLARDSVGSNNISLGGYRPDDPKWEAGRIGGALQFSRNSNYGMSSTPIRFTRYTIAFWSKLMLRDGINPRIAGPQERSWISAAFEHDNGIGVNGVRDLNEPAPEVWEHYAITIDLAAETVEVYRDGELVKSGSTKLEPAQMPWVFGHNGEPSNQNDTWFGLLDDFRIYNRVLSSEEIGKLHAAGG